MKLKKTNLTQSVDEVEAGVFCYCAKFWLLKEKNFSSCLEPGKVMTTFICCLSWKFKFAQMSDMLSEYA